MWEENDCFVLWIVCRCKSAHKSLIAPELESKFSPSHRSYLLQNGSAFLNLTILDLTMITPTILALQCYPWSYPWVISPLILPLLTPLVYHLAAKSIIYTYLQVLDIVQYILLEDWLCIFPVFVVIKCFSINLKHLFDLRRFHFIANYSVFDGLVKN